MLEPKIKLKKIKSVLPHDIHSNLPVSNSPKWLEVISNQKKASTKCPLADISAHQMLPTQKLLYFTKEQQQGKKFK